MIASLEARFNASRRACLRRRRRRSRVRTAEPQGVRSRMIMSRSLLGWWEPRRGRLESGYQITNVKRRSRAGSILPQAVAKLAGFSNFAAACGKIAVIHAAEGTKT